MGGEGEYFRKNYPAGRFLVEQSCTVLPAKNVIHVLPR